MKTILAATLFSLALLNASASSISVTVEQRAEVENKGKTNDTKNQSRVLAIAVTNLAREPKDVTVKYWFVARSMTKGTESVLKSGSTTVHLDANSTTKVDSEEATSKYTEEHVELEKSKGGGKGKSKSKAKKIPASGDRIVGYAVEVLEGNTVAATSFSNPSYAAWVTSASRPKR